MLRFPGIKVMVTQTNIDQGEPCNSKACPFALAMKDKGYGGVGVNLTLAWAKQGTWYLSKRAQKFLYDVDMGIQVKPTNFTLKGTGRFGG